MDKKKSLSKTWVAVVITAIAASLCCITPVLALLAGVSGIASVFSWIEPLRPYLIVLTILIIGFAWYQKLKPRTKKEIECGCAEDEKQSFLQSNFFLIIVTVFAILMLAFPYYSKIFFPKTENKIVSVELNNIVEADFAIVGMTCQGCEEEVKYEVAKMPGFIEATANHVTGKATVKFDKSKSTIEDVASAINKTGYKVIHQEELKK